MAAKRPDFPRRTGATGVDPEVYTPQNRDPALAEARACEASEGIEQLVLEPLVADRGMRLDPLLVVPVAARGARVCVVARGEPLLREVPEPQIVGRTGPPILVGTQPGSTALLSTSGLKGAIIHVASHAAADGTCG